MTTDNEPPFQNKREFSRVESHIPMEIRLISPEERQYIRNRVESKDTFAVKLPRDVENPLLAEWLKLLNAKLDILIKLMNAGQESIAKPVYIAKNISGGGISFTSADKFSPGEVLEVKIVLSAALSRVLFLYGEVVTSEKESEGYFTALRFILLDDAIRDEIIRFVFEKEREILREKRGE